MTDQSVGQRFDGLVDVAQPGVVCGERIDQTADRRSMRQRNPEVQRDVTPKDRKRGEILDVDIACDVCIVFDVEPDERDVGATRCEALIVGAKRVARLAPRRA